MNNGSIDESKVEIKHYPNPTGHVVYVIKNKPATDYREVYHKGMLIGLFFDNDDAVLGIRVHNTEDIYSPVKLYEMYLENDCNKEHLSCINKKDFLNWWNTVVEDDKGMLEGEDVEICRDGFAKYIEEDDGLLICEEVEVSRDDLSKYFVETVDNSNYSAGETSRTYYIHPAAGVSVKIKANGEDMVQVDYECQMISKIMITESATDKYRGDIFLFDESEEWVEDIFISLNSDWSDVYFVFNKFDLNNSSTVNSEAQAVFQLYESLNPYDIDEFKRMLREWLEDNSL